MWYHVEDATLELRWTEPKICERWNPHKKKPTMEVSQIFMPPREKRTCQPKLVRARSIGPGTLRTYQQPLALGFASWPCFTASTAPSFVIDILSANTDLQQFFLNRGVQCANSIHFSDDNAQFSTSIQEMLRILVIGRTHAVILSPPVSSLSVARNHRLL